MDIDVPCTTKDKQLFAAATTITVGNGERISFWDNAWLQGPRPRDIAPAVYNISKRKNRSLREVLVNSNWVRDLDLHNVRFSAVHFSEYCDPWRQVSQETLQPDIPDNIDWKLTADGMYTTKSAYDA